MAMGLRVGQDADQGCEKVDRLSPEEVHRTGHFEKCQRRNGEMPPNNFAAEMVGNGLLLGSWLQWPVVDSESMPEPVFQRRSIGHGENLLLEMDLDDTGCGIMGSDEIATVLKNTRLDSSAGARHTGGNGRFPGPYLCR